VDLVLDFGNISYALWGEFKQWWSSIPSIFKKKIITCPLNRTNCTQKRPWHMTLEIQILAWYRHKNVAVLNRLMGFQHYLTSHYPLANWIFNGNTYINMQIKTCIDSLLLKKTTAHVALYRTSQKWMTTWPGPGPGEIDFDMTAISWNLLINNLLF